MLDFPSNNGRDDEIITIDFTLAEAYYLDMENKTSSLRPLETQETGTSSSRLHLRVLRTELSRRKETNSRYSMRGFATDLGIEASTLCRILAGKQSMSVEMTTVILERLALSTNEKLEFVQSVATEKYEQVLEALSIKTGLNQPGL